MLAETKYVEACHQYWRERGCASRLRARHDCLTRAIALSISAAAVRKRSGGGALPGAHRASRQTVAAGCGRRLHKLFGASIEDYVLLTGEPLPPLIESCIAFLNRQGLQQQGLFRIPGTSASASLTDPRSLHLRLEHFVYPIALLVYTPQSKDYSTHVS